MERAIWVEKFLDFMARMTNLILLSMMLGFSSLFVITLFPAMSGFLAAKQRIEEGYLASFSTYFHHLFKDFAYGFLLSLPFTFVTAFTVIDGIIALHFHVLWLSSVFLAFAFLLWLLVSSISFQAVSLLPSRDKNTDTLRIIWSRSIRRFLLQPIRPILVSLAFIVLASISLAFPVVGFVGFGFTFCSLLEQLSNSHRNGTLIPSR